MAGRFKVETVFTALDKVTAPVTKMQNRIGRSNRNMQRSFRRTEYQFKRSVRAISTGARNIGIAVTAGAVIAERSINKVSTQADELAKRARRLKFPIEELQEWQFVAEQNGIATESFDKSLEKFTKTVGEAKAGTGTMITLLKKINPVLLQQINRTSSAGEAFEIYLDAMRKTEDQTIKTAMATAAFGRTGARFINITEQSSAAVRKLREEQRQNGIITMEQAKSAEAYNDAINSLKRSLAGTLQQVILPMLPVMAATVRQWREWTIANREYLTVKISEGLDILKIVLTGIGKAIVFLVKHREGVMRVIASVGVLIATFKALQAAMWLVNIAMSANPIGLIVLGVSAAIAAISLLLINLDAITDKLSTTKFFEWVGSIGIKQATSQGISEEAYRRVDARNSGSSDFAPPAPQVIGPEDRIARSIEEKRESTLAEVLLRAAPGTSAELVSGSFGGGLTMESSGDL